MSTSIVPFSIPSDKLNELSLSLLKEHDEGLYSRVYNNAAFRVLFKKHLLCKMTEETIKKPSRIIDNKGAWLDLTCRLNQNVDHVIETFKVFLLTIEQNMSDKYPHSPVMKTCPVCLIDTDEMLLPCCGGCVHVDCLILLKIQNIEKCCYCRSIY
jgi:hypothetical protein